MDCYSYYDRCWRINANNMSKCYPSKIVWQTHPNFQNSLWDNHYQSTHYCSYYYKKTSLLREKSTRISLSLLCVFDNTKSLDKCIFHFLSKFHASKHNQKVLMVLNHKCCTPEQYREVLTPYQNNVVFSNISPSGYIVILIAIVCF